MTEYMLKTIMGVLMTLCEDVAVLEGEKGDEVGTLTVIKLGSDKDYARIQNVLEIHIDNIVKVQIISDVLREWVSWDEEQIFNVSSNIVKALGD